VFTYKNIVGGYGSADIASALLSGPEVAADDLIVAWCGWNGTSGLTRSFYDSSSTYYGAGTNEAGPWTDANGQFFYLPASVAIGLPTYSLSVPGATDLRIIVWVYTPSSLPVFDQQIYSANVGFGGSASVDTGALVNTGSDELTFAGLLAMNDATPVTSMNIGGAAADGNGGFGGVITTYSWARAVAGTVNATATLNSSQNWLANAISFKIDPPPAPPTADKKGSLLMMWQ